MRTVLGELGMSVELSTAFSEIETWLVRLQESDRCLFQYHGLTKQLNLPSTERDHMTDLGAVLEQLKRERAKLDQAIKALSGVVGGKSGTASGRGGKRHLSVAARKRIAEAQRARWAKVKAKKATQK